MNPGKRLIRNTVFTLWGVAALYVGANRLNASVVDEGTSSWVGSALTLGLRPIRHGESPPDVDLATVRDFTHVSVSGRFNVEIVGAGDYKVSVTPEAGQDLKYRAWLDDGVLRVSSEGGNDGAAMATLHIEVPTLKRISVDATHITVRGIKAPEFELVSYGAVSVTLVQNQVENLRIVSYQPMEVRMDDATFAAGSIKSRGDVLIRRGE